MKLTYSILWFDDREEYLESVDIDYIKDEFSKLGFDCSIIFVTEANEFWEQSPYQDFDLILVDYSIDPDKNQYGQDFIKSVRDQEVLTEVIFYSTNEVKDLWEAVKTEKLEGVFIAQKPNEVIKLLKVAKQSINKVLDLENVRGIVMAEVGNNDEFLALIAKSAFSKLDDAQKIKQVNKYVDYEKVRYNQCKSTVEGLTNSTNIDELLEILDSTKKWEICVSLSKQVDDLNISERGNYQEDVLKKRNFLAHGLPDKLVDGALKFKHRGKEYTFDEAESLSLRENLRKYGEFFESVVKEL
jgi:hypothetical protein|tara:strand:+ start:4121 stop:5017 length:897 start_codon:yes stop_codon:yes gene_type:complete